MTVIYGAFDSCECASGVHFTCYSGLSSNDPILKIDLKSEIIVMYYSCRHQTLTSAIYKVMMLHIDVNEVSCLKAD